MFNLIKAELLKIVGKKSMKISILIVLILMVGNCLLQATNETNIKNWKEETQKFVEKTGKELEEGKGTEDEEFNEIFLRDDYEVAKYCLENEIPYNVVTPVKFVYGNTFMLPILMILLLFIAIFNFIDEFQFGTIKQILTRPYRRSTILGIKQIVFSILAVFVFLLQILISYIIGILFFHQNGNTVIDVKYLDGKIIQINMVKEIFQSVGAYFVAFLLLLGIAYLLICLVRNSILPVITTAVLWYGSGMITEYLKKKAIIKYTIFPHLDLTQYIQGKELVLSGNTLALSIVILAIHFIVIEAVVFYLFKKRDI